MNETNDAGVDQPDDQVEPPGIKQTIVGAIDTVKGRIQEYDDNDGDIPSADRS